jgi:DNA-binding CsgD family transcriptional regulator
MVTRRIDYGPNQLGRPLTSTEVQVLALLAEGMTNQEIADHRVVSLESVKTEVRLIIAKLGARNAVNAVALGYQRNILELPEQAAVSQQRRITTVHRWIESGLAAKWRVNAKVSLRRVGKECRVGWETVRRWEDGESRPSGANLDAYYAFLNVLRNLPGNGVYNED